MIDQGLLKRKQLLTERQEALLEELRARLTTLQALLERLGKDVTPADSQTLQATLEQLDELFLLVIVGEFNSGKSSFINALLGTTIQPEGVTPTTDKITLLRYGDEPQDDLREAFVLERLYPAEVLCQLTIVDTPGTNAVIRRHEELTRNFIPRADLVLFTTSADRPFTETERAFLEIIREWGKKVVIILNKADILESEAEIEQVLDFVRQHALDVLGTIPEVFAVSARRALRSRASEEGAELWQQSRFAEVERYVVETLDEETRVRLKLLSPLGIAERLTHTYRTAVEERLTVLHDDFGTLDNIDQQLTVFRQDMLHDVEYHLTDVDAILRDLEDRGLQWFDDTLRLNRIRDLMKSERLRTAFEKDVVGDVSRQVERRIQELIDWSIEKNLRLWQNVTDYINRRRMPQHSEDVIGDVGGEFDYNRSALLKSIGDTTNRVVESYDREQESQNLAQEVQTSLANSALTSIAGVGIGAALVALFSSALIDATGILLATAALTGGLFILPARRRQAKKAFRERIEEMRTQVRQSVRSQFERETESSLQRIREAISPYTRFVRARREQLTGLQRDLAALDNSLQKLRAEIEP